MAQLEVLKIVVASPGDVQAERDLLEEVAAELNRGVAADRGLRLDVVRWETDAYPGFHAQGPQGLIDKVLRIEECDILIGLFWKRFGTPTKDAKSGTEHEFRTAYAAWKTKGRPHIMVYFNQQPFMPETAEEAEQMVLVQQFKQAFPEEGLWWPYDGAHTFERLVRQHLTQFIRLHKPFPSSPPSAAGDGAKTAGAQTEREQDRAVSGSPSRGRAWPVFAMIVFAFMVWGALFYARVSETDIELDVTLTEVSFKLSAERDLFTDPIFLTELGVSGMREVQLPRTHGQAAQTLTAPALSLRADTTAGDRPSTITLDFSLRDRSVVWLSRSGLASQYRLSFLNPVDPFKALLEGQVQITPVQDTVRTFRSTIPRSITFFTAENPVHLDMTFFEGPPPTFIAQLPVDSLSLVEIQKSYEPDRPAFLPLSTIVQGTLYFEALDGKAYILRPGEDLRFRVRDGFIRTLDLADDHIVLKFNGTVEGMSSGVGKNRRTLMPSWLEYLSARHGLALLLGTVVYFFGLIYGLLRWWGISL